MGGRGGGKDFAIFLHLYIIIVMRGYQDRIGKYHFFSAGFLIFLKTVTVMDIKCN